MSNAEESSTRDIEIWAPIAIGEFFDKLTILMIKRERISDSAKLSNINKEYDVLIALYQNNIPSSSELQQLIDKLFYINNTNWNMEDAIRIKETHHEFDDEFKQIMKIILENNDIRFAIKHRINMLLESSLIEEKSYTETLAQSLEHDTKTEQSLMQSISLIYVPISVAELIDRLTILEIKLKKIDDAEKHIHIQHEYETLLEICKEKIGETDQLSNLYQQLQIANERMWEVQEPIRKKILSGQLDQEFVECARNHYYTNDERCHTKYQINILFNSALIEEKNHSNY